MACNNLNWTTEKRMARSGLLPVGRISIADYSAGTTTRQPQTNTYSGGDTVSSGLGTGRFKPSQYSRVSQTVSANSG